MTDRRPAETARFYEWNAVQNKKDHGVYLRLVCVTLSH